QTANRLLKGGSSVVSFILQDDSLEGLQKIYDPPMKHIIKAPTLGSDHTLICPYVLIAHYYESEEMLQSLGLSRYLVRVAVGCEREIEPVIGDLQGALPA
ncbi:MAG: PLP-dependent transferase, partial [Calditrichota bacterium]